MKKELLVVIQLVRRGGVELAAINFAKNIDKTKFNITFLLVNPYENQDEDLLEDLRNDGFDFIYMPQGLNGYISKYKYLDKLFSQKHFDVVHSHVIFFSAFVLMAAKKNGVSVRVSHSHISEWNNKENFFYRVYKKVSKIILNKCANYKLACSTNAGEFLYGKKEFAKNGILIPNGINKNKFIYNIDDRNEIRQEFNISNNEILVGHVGTVYKIKNQTFLIDIFNEFIKLNPNAKLILVGEIVDREPVDEKIKKYNLQNKVIYAGQRNDIFKFYKAMDIMIFPSLHEALPLSLIEAQVAQLPCLISDTVTTEVKFNDNVEFMSLSDSPKAWSETAEKLLKINRLSVSIDKLVSVYNIDVVSSKLENIYLNNM